MDINNYLLSICLRMFLTPISTTTFRLNPVFLLQKAASGIHFLSKLSSNSPPIQTGNVILCHPIAGRHCPVSGNQTKHIL